ncbi:purine-nucleoside phosphorylase [Burkholderia cepacia]|uniref:Purine-nucleoside phosphorylase n=2 Tax=Burkholderia cepacia complex TaxID=87882 RepID=A0A1B4PLY2_BURCE|nr:MULTISPECIES: purine-nucleoside phosphorylase [Burkholderia cepacia complex]AOK14951.1 purine-nucleoside phosphorylase [Burkholderia cepacia]AOK21667.1 purine-nucleoside phosphorylase [Burkholderia ubonensis]
MKSFIYAVVAATALSASYGAFAQSSQPSPTLQAAQTRVTNADETGYGAQAAAGVRAGHVVTVTQSGPGSVYFGH